VVSESGKVFFGGSKGEVSQIDYFLQTFFRIPLSGKFAVRKALTAGGNPFAQLLSSRCQVISHISVDDTRNLLYVLLTETNSKITIKLENFLIPRTVLQTRTLVRVYSTESRCQFLREISQEELRRAFVRANRTEFGEEIEKLLIV